MRKERQSMDKMLPAIYIPGGSTMIEAYVFYMQCFQPVIDLEIYKTREERDAYYVENGLSPLNK